MTNRKKLTANDVHKALLQEKMAEQRAQLSNQITPIIKTGRRIQRLFNTQGKDDTHRRKTVVVTSVALFLAVMGKRGGWLGKAARYMIVNYPGILHRFIK